MNLQILQDKILDCTKCGLVKNGGPVPFAGTKVPVMIVGMNPGSEEILIGEPFVGRSGKLLTQLLSKAGFKREDVFITNICKCATPQNREPSDYEIGQCKNWIWQEILLVKPKAIITLGALPTRLLTKAKKTRFSLGDKLGKIIKVDYMESVIIPAYHPSFLLRNGSKKDDFQVQIFCKVKDFINNIEE